MFSSNISKFPSVNEISIQLKRLGRVFNLKVNCDHLAESRHGAVLSCGSAVQRENNLEDNSLSVLYIKLHKVPGTD